MTIRKIASGQVNTTLANYVGENGHLFYDPTSRIIRISDGHTPGGVQFNFQFATTTTTGAVKIGSGIAVDSSGTISVDIAQLDIDIQALTTDVLPATNLAYNLGSPTKQWKSLYVGTSTIYLGGISLSVNTSTGQLIINNTSTAIYSAEDGTVVFPTGIVFNTASSIVLPIGGYITSVDGGSPSLVASQGNAAVISNASSFNQLYAWDNGVSIQTSANNSGTTFTTWAFNNNGSLTAPGNINWSTNYTIDGSSATNGIAMTTDRGTILFGNHPEVGGVTHFHIMKQNPEAVDLIFGDDSNNVTMLSGSGPGSGGVKVTTQDYYGTGNLYNWNFDSSGSLTVPGNISMPYQSWIDLNGDDTNWRIGMNLNAYSKSFATSTIDIVVGQGSVGPDGFSVGQTGGQSIFELNGYDRSAYFLGSVNISDTLNLQGNTSNINFANNVSIYSSSNGLIDISSGAADITVQNGVVSIVVNNQNAQSKTWIFDYSSATGATITFPDTSVQSTAWTGSTSTLVNGTWTAVLSNTGTLRVQNLQVLGTLTTINKESVTVETVGTLNFTDTTVQTTAWNTATTVYYNQIRNTPNFISSSSISVNTGSAITTGSLAYNPLTSVFTFNPTAPFNTATLVATAVTANSLGNGVISIANTSASTSTNTGALVVAGGAGINGNVNIGGAVLIGTNTNLYVNAQGLSPLGGGYFNVSPVQSKYPFNNIFGGVNTANTSVIQALSLGGTLIGTTITQYSYLMQNGGSWNPPANGIMNGGNSTYLFGLDQQPTWGNTATSAVGTPFGIYLNRIFLNAGPSSTGTVTNVYHIGINNINADAASSATITNVYGIYQANFAQSNNVSITNAYGFYGRQTTTGATATNWNLYMQGNAPNYMAGNLYIGTTAQSGGAILTVNGGVYVNGILTATTIAATSSITINGYAVSTATSFNTATLVANAVNAQIATTTTNFNTATLVANAVNAQIATTTTNFNTATLVNIAQNVVGGIGVSSLVAGTGTNISASSGTVTIWTTATGGTFNTSTLVANAVNAQIATTATNFNTATLVANSVNAQIATTATNFNTATLVNIAQNVVGGIGVSSLTAGTGTVVSASSGSVTIWINTATLMATAVTALNASGVSATTTSTLTAGTYTAVLSSATGVLSVPGTIAGTANTSTVQIQSTYNNSTGTWSFNYNGTTGTVTFPDGTVQTTAYSTGSLTVNTASFTGGIVNIGSGSSGAIFQTLVGGSSFALYSSNLVQSAQNYALAYNGASLNLNAPTSGGIYSSINNSIITTLNSTGLQINSATASTSTTTGALQVTGGVGVGGTVTASKFVGDGSSLTNITLNQAGNIIGTQTNVTLVAGTSTYLFDNTGTLTMPYNGDIVMTGTNANIIVGGNITMPNRPAFRVYGNSNTGISSTTTITSSNFTLDYQQGSALNTSTGIFTAPVAGLYMVTLDIRTNSNTNGSIGQGIVRKTVAIGGATSTQIMVEFGANTTMNHAGGSTIVKMALNDTLQVIVTSGTLNFDSNDSWAVAFMG